MRERNAKAETNDLRYQVSKRFDAPLWRVWGAWTQPEEYGRWFGATPGSVEMDLRSGGSWRLTVPSEQAGQAETMSGGYDDVALGEKFAITTHFPGGDTVMFMEFEADAGGTRLTISQDCSTPKECEGARQGSLMLLEACAEYLASVDPKNNDYGAEK